jgi:acetyl-CoA C-acetyltransferase
LIKAGDVDVVVAGGTENMDMAPFALDKARYGFRMNNGTLVDCMIKDGLWEAFNNYHMGMTAENVNDKYGITREEQDQFAAESHNKVEAAVAAGSFQEEVVPFEIKGRKGEIVTVKDEEIFRKGVTATSLAKLSPVFQKGGTITAGNACALCDAASAVVLMERSKAIEMGLKPMALLRGYAFVGIDPKRFGSGETARNREQGRPRGSPERHRARMDVGRGAIRRPQRRADQPRRPGHCAPGRSS